MNDVYAQLPQFISPIALSVGDFALRWYGLMWIVAFVVIGCVLVRWVQFRDVYVQRLRGMGAEYVWDALMHALVGALIGGRIGYVLFYDFAYFVAHPTAVVWPFVDGQFVGIAGMSFHGGVLGVAGGLWLFARRHRWHVLDLSDFIVPAIPLGYMFGRIGNFLNDELWGRATQSMWGMYFAAAPDGGTVLRHPSQLYEAFFEGVVLFGVLWWLRRASWSRGFLTGAFLCGYACARIGVEFVREPDTQVGFVFGAFTMGQVLSAAMFLTGAVLMYNASKSTK